MGNFTTVLADSGDAWLGGAVLVNARNVACFGALPFTFTRVASKVQVSK